MKDVIYTIMTLSQLEQHDNGFPDFGSTNIVGWYKDKDVAFRAVKENWGDIWECVYDYAMIEEDEEGLYPVSTRRWFFKFDMTDKEYKPIKEPEFLKHFGGFIM